MNKIKLKNGLTYPIADYATKNKIVILLGSLSASDVIESLTEEQLSEVVFLTEGESVQGIYHKQLLCGYANDGGMLTIHLNDADLCRYGLVLDEDNRIIAAPLQRYAPDGAEIVDELPDGNITDYLRIDGEYVYDPRPVPEPPVPTEPIEKRVETVEGKTAELEESLDMLLSGVTSDE